jgi:hypothetical protein
MAKNEKPRENKIKQFYKENWFRYLKIKDKKYFMKRYAENSFNKNLNNSCINSL